jgi:NADPH-dependent ferric siderophore reductase
MSDGNSISLAGVALSSDAARLLDEMCEHFVEHAEVQRTGAVAVLSSPFGTATLRLEEPHLFIALACPSQAALQMARTSIAEHMFYFAGDKPLELTWSEPASTARPPNLYEVTVLEAENVTPHMRRVRFSCDDVAPFIGGDMHVRILVPPKGRQPVWPGYRGDGRLAWPDGEDELLVRVYTIRTVDIESRELAIDFWQHPVAGISTPGADFARDAQVGDRLALLGPGGGSLPSARSILLIGDESALPAIARIAAEVPEGTDMQAIIEVLDAAEEQPLPSAGRLEVRWLHRNRYPAGATAILAEEARMAITSASPETFVWVACEKADVRSIRAVLKERRHDKRNMYVAWYWER